MRCGRRTTASASTAVTTRLADAALAPRPKYYDLTTADGIPYWKIALMHLDSMASTVLQTCAYWGNADQCTFCGIGVTLAAGRTIAKKTPEMLAEVAVAARDLDGAVDATLTTGSTATPDRGALYVGALRPRGQGGLGPARSRSSSSRRPTSTSSTACATSASTRSGSTSRLSTRRCWRGSRPARPAGVSTPTSRPGSARSRRSARARCRPTSSSAWARTRRLTVEGCKRAVDLGVYPFIVPLRPVPGSLMQDLLPPSREYVESSLPPGRPLPAGAGPQCDRGDGGLRALPGLLRDGRAGARHNHDNRRRGTRWTSFSPALRLT